MNKVYSTLIFIALLILPGTNMITQGYCKKCPYNCQTSLSSQGPCIGPESNECKYNKSCGIDSDCNPGQKCNKVTCQCACVTDAGCPTGKKCLKRPESGTGVCVECLADTDCNPEQRCSGTECVNKKKSK